MRQAKRLAGAETQSAKLYHIYRDEATGLPWVKIVVLSKSNGYTLRPMFDQYGNLLAFGCGYYLKEGAGTVEHFDIHTPTFIFRGRKAKIGWDVTPVLNPTGKINIIYYKQNTAWDGIVFHSFITPFLMATKISRPFVCWSRAVADGLGTDLMPELFFYPFFHINRRRDNQTARRI